MYLYKNVQQLCWLKCSYCNTALANTVLQNNTRDIHKSTKRQEKDTKANKQINHKTKSKQPKEKPSTLTADHHLLFQKGSPGKAHMFCLYLIQSKYEHTHTHIKFDRKCIFPVDVHIYSERRTVLI